MCMQRWRLFADAVCEILTKQGGFCADTDYGILKEIGNDRCKFIIIYRNLFCYPKIQVYLNLILLCTLHHFRDNRIDNQILAIFSDPVLFCHMIHMGKDLFHFLVFSLFQQQAQHAGIMTQVMAQDLKAVF